MTEPTKTPVQTQNGWAAVPRSFTSSLADVDKSTHAKLSIDTVRLPDSPVARKTYDFAKRELPEKTFNHSMRVWYYGYAIIETHFAHLSSLLETYYLTCLLHDIGTTPENMKSSNMSFEYYGAFQALNFLRQNGAPKDQAEAVTEAIIRHADLGETGTLTSLGMLIQLSTVLDNVGLNPHLVDKTTIESVVSLYPRKQWSSCFAAAMREEVDLKPWCHTTANEGFVEAVLNNKLMQPYE